jgi:hypothetical protein
MHGTDVYARCTPQSLCVQFRQSGRMLYDARQQFVGINEFPMKRATALEWHIHTTPEIVEPSQCNVWSTCFAVLCNDGLPWQTIIAHTAKHMDHTLLGGPLRVRLAQMMSALKSFSCEPYGFHCADQFPQAHHANTSGV